MHNLWGFCHFFQKSLTTEDYFLISDRFNYSIVYLSCLTFLLNFLDCKYWFDMYYTSVCCDRLYGTILLLKMPCFSRGNIFMNIIAGSYLVLSNYSPLLQQPFRNCQFSYSYFKSGSVDTTLFPFLR